MILIFLFLSSLLFHANVRVQVEMKSSWDESYSENEFLGRFHDMSDFSGEFDGFLGLSVISARCGLGWGKDSYGQRSTGCFVVYHRLVCWAVLIMFKVNLEKIYLNLIPHCSFFADDTFRGISDTYHQLNDISDIALVLIIWHMASPGKTKLKSHCDKNDPSPGINIYI